MQDLKEKVLLEKVVKQRDREAYGELYDRYIGKIYRFVLFKISNKEEAEDMTSDVFLKTWNYLIKENVTEVRNFRALIYKIARSRVVDYYRSQSKKLECPLDELEIIGVHDKQFKGIETQQEVEQILLALCKLKREYQDILLLRFMEEMSVAEISEALEKSKTNVRVTLHRSIKVLRKILSSD